MRFLWPLAFAIACADLPTTADLKKGASPTDAADATGAEGVADAQAVAGDAPKDCLKSLSDVDVAGKTMLQFHLSEGVDPCSVEAAIVGHGPSQVFRRGGQLALVGLPKEEVTIYFRGELGGKEGLELASSSDDPDPVGTIVTADFTNSNEAQETVAMNPMGELSGSVRAPSSDPDADLSGIRVFIPGTNYVALTDADGNWKIDALPTGEQALTVEKDGFYKSSVDVKVESAAPVEVPPVSVVVSTGVEGSFMVENRETYSDGTTSWSRTVDLLAGINLNKDPAVLMKYSLKDNFEGVDWQPFVTRSEFVLDDLERDAFTEGPVDVEIFAKFANANGLESSLYKTTVLVDLFPDGADVVLAEGAESVKSRQLDVAIRAPQKAVEYKISHDMEQLAGEDGWQPVVAETTHLVPGQGTHTIYVTFRDADGYRSPVYSDDVTVLLFEEWEGAISVQRSAGKRAQMDVVVTVPQNTTRIECTVEAQLMAQLQNDVRTRSYDIADLAEVEGKPGQRTWTEKANHQTLHLVYARFFDDDGFGSLRYMASIYINPFKGIKVSVNGGKSDIVSRDLAVAITRGPDATAEPVGIRYGFQPRLKGEFEEIGSAGLSLPVSGANRDVDFYLQLEVEGITSRTYSYKLRLRVFEGYKPEIHFDHLGYDRVDFSVAPPKGATQYALLKHENDAPEWRDLPAGGRYSVPLDTANRRLLLRCEPLALRLMFREPEGTVTSRFPVVRDPKKLGFGCGQLAAASLPGAPSGRAFHSLVWTGSQVLVWGGRSVTGEGGFAQFKDGASLRLGDTRWQALPTAGAPRGRSQHTTVWTGTSMIVWGGNAAMHPYDSQPLDDGAMYTPGRDGQPGTWEALPPPPPRFRARWGHSAVWTGSEMIIWGGEDETGHVLGDGARYDPATKSWKTVSSTRSPAPRAHHTAVWHGGRMIIWGGYSGRLSQSGEVYHNTGGSYSPSRDFWGPVAIGQPRAFHSAVVYDSKMLVYGGANAGCRGMITARDRVDAYEIRTCTGLVTMAQEYDLDHEEWRDIDNSADIAIHHHQSHFAQGQLIQSGGVHPTATRTQWVRVAPAAGEESQGEILKKRSESTPRTVWRQTTFPHVTDGDQEDVLGRRSVIAGTMLFAFGGERVVPDLDRTLQRTFLGAIPQLGTPSLHYEASPRSQAGQRKLCHHLGMRVLEVDSPAIAAEANAFLREVGATGGIHLGATRNSRADGFTWLSEAAVGGDGFTAWLAGAPDNRGGSEDCLESVDGRADAWNDIDCDASRPTVCFSQELSQDFDKK